MLSLGLDARQLEFFAEDVGQLVERDVDLEDVLPRIFPAHSALPLVIADRLTRLAVALSDAAGVVVAVTEARQIDPVYGDADEVLALFADQLAARQKLAQILADPSLDDLAEALMVF